MGREIERKFLVRNDAWREGATATRFRQGFLSTHPDRTVRVRVAGTQAWLTIKGRNVGARRAEYEYEIPQSDAEQMLDALCEQPLVEKTRYVLVVSGDTWEVDVFEGVNEGLVVAEIELASEAQTFVRPDWLGAEVTEDPRYFNSNLVSRPFTTWSHRDGD